MTNINEDGTLMLSPDQPGISVALDATLTDPDKGITGAKWQWMRWHEADAASD